MRRLEQKPSIRRNATSGPRQRHQEAAGSIVEERSAHRALPPARGERGVLVVADHDEIDPEALREAADLLHRLADRELARGLEAALAQVADALVEHGLGALLLFLEQLLGHEALGEEEARRHRRDREQVGFGLQEARE